MIRIPFAAWLSAMLSGGLLAAEEGPLAAQAGPGAAARESIARALPFIEAEGVRWMEQRKCVTCHHTGFMTWSLNAAAAKGFTVDPAKAAEYEAWARDFRSVRGRDKTPDGVGSAEETFRNAPAETAQLLFAAAARGTRPKAPEERKWAAAMRSHLVAGQRPDGSWKAGGQLPGQKRPLRETEEVVTTWALLALDFAEPQDEALQAAGARSAAWLKEPAADASTERRAVDLLWKRRRGDDEAADAARRTLLERQHSDGGWGWLPADESDALGTGLALYALRRDQPAGDEAAVAKAAAFLRRTQKEDGAWPVRGTKKDKRGRVEPTATYWGTCWAVLGLLETLPAPAKAPPAAAD